MKFAYSTINWGTTPDLEQTFGEIRDAGWIAVELFLHPLGWLGTPDQLRRKLGDLEVATLFGRMAQPADDPQLTVMKNEIVYAAELGATDYGLIGGDRLRWRPPSADDYREVAVFCEELAVFAADLGVRVAYHPHTACTIETETEIDRLMDLTEVLTLCLDVSHIAVVGEDPVAHLRNYRSRTGYIHFKDWGYGKFVEMGQGTVGIDFAACLRELEASDFGGWVVVEQSRSDVSPLESAKANAAYLQGLGYRPDQ